MFVDINSYQIYIGLIINGIFTGAGVTLGTWVANQKVIKMIEKLTTTEKKILEKIDEKRI